MNLNLKNDKKNTTHPNIDDFLNSHQWTRKERSK